MGPKISHDKLELITWRDSSSTGGWTNFKGALSINISAGYVVREDDDCVVLAQSVCLLPGYLPYANLQTIDKRAIREREELLIYAKNSK